MPVLASLPMQKRWPPEPTECRMLPGGRHADNGDGNCWACGQPIPKEDK